MQLRLTVELGTLEGQVFVVDRGTLALGRDAACTACFAADARVSRRHAEVRVEGGQAFVHDLGSTNGTLVNGQPVSVAPLGPGDLIQLGPEGPRLRVALGDAAAAPASATASRAAARQHTSSLDISLYDPARDRGRRYSVTSLLVVFGMLGCGAFLGMLVALLSLFALGPAAALVGVVVAFAPAPFYLAIWLWLDRYDPEPLWALAAALVWGAGAATFVSGLVNDLFQGTLAIATQNPDLATFLSASLSAPLIEEVTKAFALLLIWLSLRREFDGVLDGVVYAGVVALGFATVENVLYYGRAAQQHGAAGLIAVFVLRGVLGPFTHAIYTSMTGIGCGIARETHNPALKLLAPAAGLTLAVLLHSLWNTLASLAGGAFFLFYLVFWLPLFLAFFAAVVYMGYRESRLIRRMLEFEVARGLLSREQAEIVASWPRRIRWLAQALDDRTRLGARRQFLRAATRLALCYGHVERAQAAGGVTLSLGQIPTFRHDVAALVPRV